jgi:indole-3-glycerol phosphate synthase
MQIRRRSPSPTVVAGSLSYELCLPGSKPQNLLEEIVWHKEEEVEHLREKLPLAQLKTQVAQQPPPLNFLKALITSSHPVALIAEVKRASPSKGILREDFDPVAIAQAYEAAGASCLSVLTDQKYFQGSGEYLRQIREAVRIPLLCKEFILYPYQLFWARLLGADAVLLIAAILTDTDLAYFLKITHLLGMVALVEVHTLAELDRVLALPTVQLVGINNRDLTNFEVSLKTSELLLQARGESLAQRQITVVSESGIFVPEDLRFLQRVGVRAVLVGEALVKAPDPGAATRALLS